MMNPFEDDHNSYYALINEEGQYSLWPTFIGVPKGWIVACGSGSRTDCLKFIEQHWTDMRPKRL